jgi:hypothetical protein
MISRRFSKRCSTVKRSQHALSIGRYFTFNRTFADFRPVEAAGTLRMYPGFVDRPIPEALSGTRIVTTAGPRQSGKTTPAQLPVGGGRRGPAFSRTPLGDQAWRRGRPPLRALSADRIRQPHDPAARCRFPCRKDGDPPPSTAGAMRNERETRLLPQIGFLVP